MPTLSVEKMQIANNAKLSAVMGKIAKFNETHKSSQYTAYTVQYDDYCAGFLGS